MSSTNHCPFDEQQRAELMLGHVAGVLDLADEQQVVEHLAEGCEPCTRALATAQNLLAEVVGSIPPQSPPATERAKLMRRVTAERGASPATGRPYALAAALIAALVALTWQYLLVQNARHEQVHLAAQLNQRETDISDLRRMLGSETLRMVSLGDEKTRSHGRILWDTEHQQWHVYVFDLAPPPPGRTYELWFITPDQKKLPGPTFDVDASGRAVVVADVPQGLDQIAVAAITDEPRGGVAVPTGNVHLAGAVP